MQYTMFNTSYNYFLNNTCKIYIITHYNRNLNFTYYLIVSHIKYQSAASAIKAYHFPLIFRQKDKLFFIV